MYMNVLSVRVRAEDFTQVAQMYRGTIDRLAAATDGFRGMMGLHDTESGEVMSISLNEHQDIALEARDSEANQQELQLYDHLFLSPPERDLYRVEVRYMPMNRPFPGEAVVAARTTTGFVQPRDVSRAIQRIRDSLVFAAIDERGCCGFLLGANHQTGKIFGASLWDSYDNLHASESERGYYHRELKQLNDVRISELDRGVYDVFERVMGRP